MPDGFYKIVVVCSHHGRGFAQRTRVIARLTWLEPDPEDEAAFRKRLGRSEEALQIILLNDRFSRKERWVNRAGREVIPAPAHRTYWLEDPDQVVDRAGALGAFRFQCQCGIDRPSRQSTLDRWIREQIAHAPSRRRFEYDISC